MTPLLKTPVQTHNELLDAIESLMDKTTVAGMLGLMAETASAKADHIRENWQDEATASVWDKMAASLMNAQE